MTDTIVVEDVYKAYGDVNALNGVSLSVREGKIFGLLGPNGAGKTTLVRILTTLLKPDAGRVEVAGIDVLKDSMALRRVIGLAGQYPAVDEQLTGRENLVMVGQLYHFSRSEAKSRAQDLLKRFSLTDAADRPVKTYSGGMRRRLDLAASIVARPKVLFLDEPTTGLDPRTRMEAWEFIRELVRDGATLLLTTQYLEEADALTGFITVIDEGRVIAEGTPDELKSRLGSDVLELRVSRDINLKRVESLLQPIGKDMPQIDLQSGDISIAVNDGTRSLLDAVRILDGEGISIEDIGLRRPTLDDVFLSITGK
ncbi:MAG: ATP-binding cassette domain-containing protein [Chloroflexi bacterium]|nr:ATP-binding cassette domain-containing protein [Chloroflexota bacterium]